MFNKVSYKSDLDLSIRLVIIKIQVEELRVLLLTFPGNIRLAW
jgi:hypothetical protein